MKKKLTNLAGECPFCQSTNLDYGVIELVDDMQYYPWRCKDCGHKGEEWYELKFTGHNIITEKGDSIEVEYYNATENAKENLNNLENFLK